MKKILILEAQPPQKNVYIWKKIIPYLKKDFKIFYYYCAKLHDIYKDSPLPYYAKVIEEIISDKEDLFKLLRTKGINFVIFVRLPNMSELEVLLMAKRFGAKLVYLQHGFHIFDSEFRKLFKKKYRYKPNFVRLLLNYKIILGYLRTGIRTRSFLYFVESLLKKIKLYRSGRKFHILPRILMVDKYLLFGNIDKQTAIKYAGFPVDATHTVGFYEYEYALQKNRKRTTECSNMTIGYISQELYGRNRNLKHMQILVELNNFCSANKIKLLISKHHGDKTFFLEKIFAESENANIVMGQGADVVIKSDIVLTHYSTLIILGVLMKRKIICIDDLPDVLIKGSWLDFSHYPNVRLVQDAEELKMNLDEMLRFPSGIDDKSWQTAFLDLAGGVKCTSRRISIILKNL